MWLAGQLKNHASVTVKYKRGVESVSVSATVGRSMFELVSAANVLTKLDVRDYLILADDLILSGSGIQPQAGDTIEETQVSIKHTYEVMSPGDEPLFRFADEFRTMLRIHTKEISSGAV